jgi:hypothetical protein
MVVDAPMRESSTPGTYRWPNGPKPQAADECLRHREMS